MTQKIEPNDNAKNEQDEVLASAFGSKDFSHAFETGASGKLADKYRDLKQESYSDCGHELVLSNSVDNLDDILGQDRLAQKILEIPVHDSLANWRTFNNQEADLAESQLRVSQAFQEAAIFARTHGVAAIYPIVKDADGRIAPGSIKLETLLAREQNYEVDKLLVVTDKLRLSSDLETNFYLDYYNWPKKIYISNTPIHPSRIVLIGDVRKSSFFSSICNSLSDYHESKRRLQIAVRKNSAMALETSVKKLRQQLQAQERATGREISIDEVLMSRARSLYENLNDVNVAIINEGEKLHHFEQSKIDDLIDAVLLAAVLLAGEVDIIYSRLFSKSGNNGLNTNNDAESENYTQSLQTLRSGFIETPLSIYDKIMSQISGQEIRAWEWNNTKSEELRLARSATNQNEGGQ